MFKFDVQISNQEREQIVNTIMSDLTEVIRKAVNEHLDTVSKGQTPASNARFPGGARQPIRNTFGFKLPQGD